MFSFYSALKHTKLTLGKYYATTVYYVFQHLLRKDKNDKFIKKFRSNKSLSSKRLTSFTAREKDS